MKYNGKTNCSQICDCPIPNLMMWNGAILYTSLICPFRGQIIVKLTPMAANALQIS